MVVLTVVVFGVLSLRLLPVNMMPEITYPSLTVRTEYPGAAPEEVEETVTRPLEQTLGVLRNLVEISSSSRAEYSDVLLEFGWDTDMNQATQEVREKLDLVFLPEDVKPPLILRYDPTLDPLMRIGLTSDSLAPRDLRDLAERVVKTELEKLPGVAAVKVKGGEEAEIRVAVNAAALDLLNLALGQIAGRLASENVNVAGGRLQDGSTEYILRTLSEFTSVDEISSIVIDQREGRPIRLADVARVSSASKEITTITRAGGRPSVELELFRESDANPVRVSDVVRERLFGKEWMAGVQPARKKVPQAMPGLRRGPTPLQESLTARIQISLLADQAEFLRSAVGEVESAAIVGGLLAILVLFLFLGNLRDTLIVAVVIPISLVCAFAAMNLGHVTLNVMSLGGLALGVGMMVDNSIVVVESIFRRREQGEEIAAASVWGTRIVGGAVIASTLTTVVVFFPVVFVTGVAGQIFGDLAMTVIIALSASLLVALFFVPMLVVKLQKKPAALEGGGRLVQPVRKPLDAFGAFTGGVKWWWELKPLRRWASLLFVLVYLLLRLILDLIGTLISHLFHYCASGIVWIVRGPRDPASPSGLSLTARLWNLFWSPFGLAGAFFRRWIERVTIAYVGFLATQLERPLPALLTAGIVAMLSFALLLPRLGRELMPEVSQGTFDVHFTMPVGTPLQRTDAVVKPLEEVVQRMSQVASVSSRAGSDPSSAGETEEGSHTAILTVRLKQGAELESREAAVVLEIRRLVGEIPSLEMRITHPALFTFKHPVEIIIKADDPAILRRVSGDISARLHDIPFLADVETSVRPGHPEVAIRFDRDRLALLGLSAREAAERVKAAVLGNVPTKFRGDEERRIDIRVNLRLQDRQGTRDLEDLVINPGQTIPVRLAEVARLDLLEGPAEIRHMDGSRSARVTARLVAVDLSRGVAATQDAISRAMLPPNVLVEVGGQHREMQESLGSLYWALLLAVFLVYVVMASQFESFGNPLLILLTIPLAVAGVIPVLWALDLPLSVMVYLGLIILAGIVVNNSIVLVDYANQLRREGLTVTEALTNAAGARLRPILMTTLTTILGLFPMAFGLGEGEELRRPMAITVMAGLSLGTLVTLLVIPVLYRLTAKSSDK